jgi:hypothetical protein
MRRLCPDRLSAGSTEAQLAAYFACSDSMYLVRFTRRRCTSLSCPLLTLQNDAHHTGISLDPCAGTADSLRMEDETLIEGSFPPLFLLSSQRNGGINQDAARTNRGLQPLQQRCLQTNGTVSTSRRPHFAAGNFLLLARRACELYVGTWDEA